MDRDPSLKLQELARAMKQARGVAQTQVRALNTQVDRLGKMLSHMPVLLNKLRDSHKESLVNLDATVDELSSWLVTVKQAESSRETLRKAAKGTQKKMRMAGKREAGEAEKEEGVRTSPTAAWFARGKVRDVLVMKTAKVKAALTLVLSGGVMNTKKLEMDGFIASSTITTTSRPSSACETPPGLTGSLDRHSKRGQALQKWMMTAVSLCF